MYVFVFCRGKWYCFIVGGRTVKCGSQQKCGIVGGRTVKCGSQQNMYVHWMHSKM